MLTMACKRWVFDGFKIACFIVVLKQSKDGTIDLIRKHVLSSIFLKRNALGALIVLRPNIRQIWLIFFSAALPNPHDLQNL